MYNLHLDAAGNFVSWDSYVRMRDGELIDAFDPVDYPKVMLANGTVV